MAKSIAELRAERSTTRPSRVYRVVAGEGQKYVAETQSLTAENDELLERHYAEQQGPRKAGERPELPARVVEIRERLAELADLMAEYEGDLTITATLSDGAWDQWKIEHPARDEDQPGHTEDDLVGRVCNATDLINDLATFVTHWEGEELQSGDFDALNILRGDRKEIAQRVVSMYEVAANLPKLRSGLQVLLANGPSSPSRDASASVSDDSSAGSQPSDTTTTTPTES